ncbi:MAG: hypothetical protein K9H26_04245 [Prolixibacteraceae bacterium]|nr:hypothetical protein [Prolixibacteraceae bacterium]
MKKSISTLLSFILLSSHMYLTMGTHFCGGEAVESKIIFGETHLGCDMMETEKSCDDSEHTNNNQVSFNKFPCCQNEFHTIQSTDDFVKDATQTVFNDDFAVAFLYSLLNLDIRPRTTHQFYTDYISPSLEKDVQVLFQTFLI